MMEIDAQLTEDGSSTLYSREYLEHYHSTHGAIQESFHVFINAGLNCKHNQSAVRILEVGFGTGLNALLSWHNAFGRKIEYVGIETRPVNLDIVHQLNYAELLEDNRAYDAFVKLHIAPWGEWIHVYDNFSLLKLNAGIQDVELPGLFDVVYFDAFSPKAQPEMWDVEVFRKIYQSCSPGAVFVTYCAKGQVRRDLETAGFAVERLPGPPGKREILRARVKVDV